MSIRRGWTAEQDKILKTLKQQRNIKKWSSIARIMDFQFNMCGRNGKQCRQRYNNHLNEGILEQRLTFEEEKLLQNLNDQIGNKWSVIVKVFKGRTANFLKNQLYSKLRKSIRKLNKFIKQRKLKSVKPYKLSVVFKIVQSNDFKIFQKQRHSPDDLNFYADIKQKLFKYAQQPLSLEGQQSQKDKQVIQFSLAIIQNLNQFSKKYDSFNKKIKKPRRKYFCEDDIILNSLSNGRNVGNLIVNNIDRMQQQSGSKHSSIESDQSSETSDKKDSQQINIGANRLQLKLFSTKKFDEEKYKQQYKEQFENTPKDQCRTKIKTVELQKMANQNCKIVEQAEVGHINNGYHLLEQSQQCQFIDIQYMEQFKSCSLIDQSLFQ